MCGRTSVLRSPEEIGRVIGASRVAGRNTGPRFNVSPTQSVPVVYKPRGRGKGTPKQSQSRSTKKGPFRPLPTASVANQPQQASHNSNQALQVKDLKNAAADVDDNVIVNQASALQLQHNQEEEEGEEEEEVVVEMMTWGLRYTTLHIDPASQQLTQMFQQQHNVRTDNTRLLLKPTAHRCVVLLDGFFEWNNSALGGIDPGDSAKGDSYRGFVDSGKSVVACKLEDDSDITANKPNNTHVVKRPYFIQNGSDMSVCDEYRHVISRLKHSKHSHTLTRDTGSQQEMATASNMSSVTSAALERPLLWVAAVYTDDRELGHIPTPSHVNSCDDVDNDGMSMHRSVGVLTTSANTQVHWLHERMPFVLTPTQAEMWLDDRIPNHKCVSEILSASPDPVLTPLSWYEVGKVGNTTVDSNGRVRGDTHECIMPVEVWKQHKMNQGIGRFAVVNSKVNIDTTAVVTDTPHVLTNDAAVTDAHVIASDDAPTVVHKNDDIVVSLLKRPRVCDDVRGDGETQLWVTLTQSQSTPNSQSHSQSHSQSQSQPGLQPLLQSTDDTLRKCDALAMLCRQPRLYAQTLASFNTLSQPLSLSQPQSQQNGLIGPLTVDQVVQRDEIG